MNSITFAFIISFIASISTLIGIIPIYLNIKNTSKLISSSLSFAAGIMLSVSIFSLLKESYMMLENIYLLVLFISIGMLISKFINTLLSKIDDKLYKLGIINTIALMLHNIPEGILTFSTTTINIKLGLSLALAIVFHNIPEGISISIPVYYSTKSKVKAWSYTLISGFSELLGSVACYLFLYKFLNNNLIGIILSLTSGIMMYISLFELLPNSLKYNNKNLTYIFFIIGFIFMIFFK